MPVPFEQGHELFSTTVNSPVTQSPPCESSQSASSQPGRRSPLPLILPAIYQGQDRILQLVGPANGKDLWKYLRADLDVDSLNKVHKHLWFAGLPQCARALHHQLMLGRRIVITERADLHLLWRDDRLYLKPLPDYLLCHKIWEDALPEDRDLPQNARGFLLSYLWLIRQKSDFVIARRENLVSSDLMWEQWTSFSSAIFNSIDPAGLQGISPRYLYGELRLARVNWIYRLCHNTIDSETFIRGYLYGYQGYSSFIAQNFAWVLTAIVYVTIVLTAMQVGLATTELKDSTMFNRASYGFTFFSIVAPLGVMVVALFVLLVLVIFNVNHTLERRRAAQEKYPTVFENEALQIYKH